MRNNKKLILLAACCLALSGCGTKVEEEPLVVVDTSPDEVTYNLVDITQGDVVKTKLESCSYVQTKEQEVSFNSGGKIVDRVYVKIGDHVEVGDLLVELKNDNIDEDIARLEYQIKRNELLLSYLDKAEEFDLENSYYDFVYNTDTEEEDLKEKEENDEEIEDNYTYRREDYEDNIEFDKLKLQELKKELASSRIYANMSGKVLTVKSNLEGSTAKRGDVIMTIVDNANGIFEIEDKEATAYIKDGDTFTMNIVYGTAKGVYELTPYNMSSWGDKQQFSVISGPDSVSIEVGTTGSMTIPIDKKENVARIPLGALYEAEGKYYTYVLNADNLREVRFIDVGLVGDEYAEVLSGVELGTKVVRR